MLRTVRPTSPIAQSVPNAPFMTSPGSTAIGFATSQTGRSSMTGPRLGEKAASRAMTAIITTSRAATHRHRGERRRPSGKVNITWKMGKMRNAHDHPIAHSTSQRTGPTSVGCGSSDASHRVANSETGSARPGTISNGPMMLPGRCVATMAPDTTNAPRPTSSAEPATMSSRTTVPVVDTYTHVSRPIATIPIRATSQTRRLRRSPRRIGECVTNGAPILVVIDGKSWRRPSGICYGRRPADPSAPQPSSTGPWTSS